MASQPETAAMRRAVVLASMGLGTTSPNPVVGAVVLAPDGSVLGEGAHLGGPGHPHAEIVALDEAGKRARGATAVITLEPCNHVGRTGACTDALLRAGIARVVYAVDDPNPAAAGGATRLRSAGVDVEAGVLRVEAARGNEAWLLAVGARRPFVTWKYAATLDGRVAAADATSRWVTGTAARADVHRLRAAADAVLVGVGTVLADDPELTVRDADGRTTDRQPLRVVLDTALRTPVAARVLGSRCLLVAAEGTVAAGCGGRLDAEILRIARDGSADGEDGSADGDHDGAGRLDLRAVLRDLYRRGVRHVLLEGGPTLAGAFVRARLVDRVVGYYAPKLLGAGPAALGPAGITTIAGALQLDVEDVTTVGCDIRVLARPAAGGS